MYGFQQAASELRGIMLKDVNAMNESALQDLLERSYHLIKDLQDYRATLAGALYKRLSNK